MFQTFAGDCKMDQWLWVNSGDFRRLRLRLIFLTHSWQRSACKMHKTNRLINWGSLVLVMLVNGALPVLVMWETVYSEVLFKCQCLRVIKVYVWVHSQGTFCCVIIWQGMWSISTRAVRSSKFVDRYLPLLRYFILSFPPLSSVFPLNFIVLTSVHDWIISLFLTDHLSGRTRHLCVNVNTFLN